MIYILHGENIADSYDHLQTLAKNYSHDQIIWLTKEKNKQDLTDSISSKSLFWENQFIICEDFLSHKKITIKDIQNLPKNSNIIFWEKKKLKISKEAQKLSVYEHKLPSALFQFLDSISPQYQNWLPRLTKIDNPNLRWHILYRFLLMVIAKNDLSLAEASAFLKKPIAIWQWQKVKIQTQKFTKSSLYKIYSSLLKLDYMKKQGLANFDDSTLITLLFLRHLRS